WMQKAASANHRPAQAKLGEAYATGSGLEQDFRKALHWFRAAGFTQPRACLGMGRLYEQGLGVAKDSGQANMWFVCAASFGTAPDLQGKTPEIARLTLAEIASAYAQLAENFAKGTVDFPQNDVTAYVCYALATQIADNGQYGAALHAAKKKMLSFEPNQVHDWNRMIQEQLNPLIERWRLNILSGWEPTVAVNLLRAFARLGDRDSQSFLATIAGVGRDGLPLDPVSAYAWYSIAQNRHDAQPTAVHTNRAGLVKAIQGNPPSSETARPEELLNKHLSKEQLAEAQLMVGEFFQSGLRVPLGNKFQDYGQAAKWYAMAADNGNAEAQSRLGSAYAPDAGAANDPALTQLFNLWSRSDFDIVQEQEHWNKIRANLRKEIEDEWLQKHASEFQQAHESDQLGLNLVNELLDYDAYRVSENAAQVFTRLAIDILRWWAERNNAEAQYRLGTAKSSGILGKSRIQVDHNEAAQWLLKAAEAGHKEAQFRLANAYEKGLGVTKDPSEARKWSLKSGISHLD
ncbi:MAG TPA: hypothetical protein VN444_01150, partial [Verrucomicrobiae bacterium]|nr:hypothetical protein [Verrucomicrobiae bacterium]